jgi:guanylate kinase
MSLLFVISSPSGAGKTTLCQKLRRKVPNLVHALSVTTRPPRAGEQNGHDYLFVSPQTFKAFEQEGRFLETVNLFEHRYGTLTESIQDRLDEGKDVLLVLDVQGAKAVRSKWPKQTISIFVLPPSLEVLQERLEGRNPGSTSLEKRLQRALQEVQCAEQYDHMVLNDDLENALQHLESILKLSRRAYQVYKAYPEILRTFQT